MQFSTGSPCAAAELVVFEAVVKNNLLLQRGFDLGRFIGIVALETSRCS